LVTAWRIAQRPIALLDPDDERYAWAGLRRPAQASP
jgi:hypothetical protein